MKVYIGGDHRGFHLKEILKRYLAEKEIELQDEGAFSLDPHDDYTLFAEKVAILVSAKNANGVLLCGSGVGVDVTANKFDGVRAAIGVSPEQVKAGRSHDDMNILVLASDFTNEHNAKLMLDAFLHTPFDGKTRHIKRLEEIEKIEKNN